MRISEVTDRTGIPARLLRYYEEQKLLVPARNASGYRDYSSQDVEVARRIRQLLDAGLSTATIRTVLPCLTERAGRLAPICEETDNELKRDHRRIPASPGPDPGVDRDPGGLTGRHLLGDRRGAGRGR